MGTSSEAGGACQTTAVGRPMPAPDRGRRRVLEEVRRTAHCSGVREAFAEMTGPLAGGGPPRQREERESRYEVGL